MTRYRPAYSLFRRTRNWTEDDRDLADKMSDALIAFARTGDPNTRGLDFFRTVEGTSTPGTGAPPGSH